MVSSWRHEHSTSAVTLLCFLVEIQKISGFPEDFQKRPVESSQHLDFSLFRCTALGSGNAEKIPSSVIRRKVSLSHLECCIHHHADSCDAALLAADDKRHGIA